MTNMIESLLSRYWDWVQGQTSVRDLGGTYEITTPYLNRFNDFVQVYAKMIKPSRILVTDGGETMEEFGLSEYSNTTRRWTPIIQEILNGFSIKMNEQDRSLNTEGSIQDFPLATHNLIQAILAINDVGYMSGSGRSTIQSAFRKQVDHELASFDWEVKSNPKFQGGSGVPRKFHFMVKSEKIPTVIQCFGSIDKQRADAFVLSFLDVQKKQSDGQMKCSALIKDDDEESLETPLAIMRSFDIHAVVASSGISKGLQQIMASTLLTKRIEA